MNNALCLISNKTLAGDVDVYSYSDATPAEGRPMRARAMFVLYVMETLSTQG